MSIYYEYNFNFENCSSICNKQISIKRSMYMYMLYIYTLIYACGEMKNDTSSPTKLIFLLFTLSSCQKMVISITHITLDIIYNKYF